MIKAYSDETEKFSYAAVMSGLYVHLDTAVPLFKANFEFSGHKYASMSAWKCLGNIFEPHFSMTPWEKTFNLHVHMLGVKNILTPFQ